MTKKEEEERRDYNDFTDQAQNTTAALHAPPKMGGAGNGRDP